MLCKVNTVDTVILRLSISIGEVGGTAAALINAPFGLSLKALLRVQQEFQVHTAVNDMNQSRLLVSHVVLLCDILIGSQACVFKRKIGVLVGEVLARIAWDEEMRD